jgi:serine/threonine protein kinase
MNVRIPDPLVTETNLVKLEVGTLLFLVSQIPYKCINDNHLKALSRRGVEVRGVLGAEAQGVALDVIRDRGDPIVAKISPNENRNVLRVLKNNPHPSIIGYRDFWRAGWFDFVLMEKFGKNLRYPKAAGLVSERDALTCVKDVGEGLAHLTKIGIRHNDLHKGNVVFKDGRCKIIDFGLATAGNTEPGLRDNVLFVDKLTLLAEIESASVEKISALLFDAPVKMQEALNRERDGEPGLHCRYSSRNYLKIQSSLFLLSMVV